MVFVRLLSKLLRDKDIGRLIVPIVPDEARTFGMEALFRQVGIYSHAGQMYEPVDMDTLLYYKEASDGQILEEGINEAGSMSSFIAAGTAYATHGVNTIPFFIYYSMFGFQRIGDLIWAAADSRTRGFLLGGTAGRTTLAGEGLQHQDGNSQLFALAYPNCLPYDPAFAYEIAVIIEDGIKRMYVDQESIFYYLTVMNEQYEMPAMPEGSPRRHSEGPLQVPRDVEADGEVAGAAVRQRRDPARSHQGAGDARVAVQRRRRRLERHELRAALSRRARGRSLEHAASGRDAEGAVRHAVAEGRAGRVRRRVRLREGAARTRSIAGCRVRSTSLGTDGFGRSESRASLRDFFEVDHRYIVIATLRRAGERRQARAVGRAGSDQGARCQCRQAQPGGVVDGTDFTLPELGENIAAGDVLRMLVQGRRHARRKISRSSSSKPTRRRSKCPRRSPARSRRSRSRPATR